MRPEWCPADVWDAADRVAALSLPVVDGTDRTAYAEFYANLHANAARVIARAILAEREAAARFVRTMAVARAHAGNQPNSEFVPRLVPAYAANATARAIINGLHRTASIDPAADGGGTAPIGAAATQSDGGGE